MSEPTTYHTEREMSAGWRHALADKVNPDRYTTSRAYAAGADATDGKRIFADPRRGLARSGRGDDQRGRAITPMMFLARIDAGMKT